MGRSRLPMSRRFQLIAEGKGVMAYQGAHVSQHAEGHRPASTDLKAAKLKAKKAARKAKKASR